MKNDTGLKEVWQQLDRLWDWQDRRSPFTSCQIVTVAFTTANADTDVAHSLTPADPANIIYIPVRSSAAGIVYNDQSASRKPWQKGYILLRCSAVATVTLLLAVPRDTL